MLSSLADEICTDGQTRTPVRGIRFIYNMKRMHKNCLS